MTRQPRVALRPDGSSYIVDEAGNPVPDNQRIVLSAAELARMVAGYVAAERQAGSARIQAAADAGVKAGAQAGVQAGARYTLQHTRHRRTVERNPGGQIVAIVDSREPLPSPAKRAEKPAREPMGFRPR